MVKKPTKKELYDLYWKQNKTIKEMAKELGIHSSVVYRHIKKEGIPTRSSAEAQKIKPVSKQNLYNLYWVQGKSIHDISKNFSITGNTVLKWMKQYGIKRRSIAETRITKIIPEKQLRDLYRKQKKSTYTIKEMFGVDSATVRSWLIKYGIPIRNKSEAQSGTANFMYGKFGGKHPRFGKRHSPETIRKLSECKRGNKSLLWRGGISLQPYGVDWTGTLRRAIRERDHYTCQLCRRTPEDECFSVHHVDYDKNNNSPDNLLTLCKKCHSKTNFNREYWEEYFALSLLM